MNVFKAVFSANEIKQQVIRLSAEINQDYQGQPLTLVGVLKGAINFFTSLAPHLKMPVRYDFLRVESYYGTKSTGEVSLKLDLSEPIEGQHVLLIEDMIDTGCTLQFLRQHLSIKQPASLKVCTLLYKDVVPALREQIDYIGFESPKDYLIGYGMDYNGLYRNLPYIAKLPEDLGD